MKRIKQFWRRLVCRLRGHDWQKGGNFYVAPYCQFLLWECRRCYATSMGDTVSTSVRVTISDGR